MVRWLTLFNTLRGDAIRRMATRADEDIWVKMTISQLKNHWIWEKGFNGRDIVTQALFTLNQVSL